MASRACTTTTWHLIVRDWMMSFWINCGQYTGAINKWFKNGYKILYIVNYCTVYNRGNTVNFAILSLLFPVENWAVMRTRRLQHFLFHLQPGRKPQDIFLQHPSSHHLWGNQWSPDLSTQNITTAGGSKGQGVTYSRCCDDIYILTYLYS